MTEDEAMARLEPIAMKIQATFTGYPRGDCLCAMLSLCVMLLDQVQGPGQPLSATIAPAVLETLCRDLLLGTDESRDTGRMLSALLLDPTSPTRPMLGGSAGLASRAQHASSWCGPAFFNLGRGAACPQIRSVLGEAPAVACPPR
jgi:hypothetical protein